MQVRPAEPDVPTTAAREPRRARRPRAVEPLAHLPGLDGLRGVAVAVVLCFHARFGWATGGFLGVSTFFTLSGFLITSLLVREHLGQGHVSLRRFWTRRVRRLVPASWVTLALVVGMAGLGWFDTEQVRDLRGDVPAALAQVINWHFIVGDRSYGDQFVSPSPLEHYWSLAVEEQFYLFFPVLVVGLLVWGRGRRSWLIGVLAGMVVVGAAWTDHLASGSIDRAYFGTDTRLAELVVGALLALVLLRALEPRTGTGRWARQIMGVVGLGVSVWLWTTVTVGTRWLYPWGLLLTAVASASLIVGVLAPGPFRSAFSWRPLVALGGISYGVYLLHWPVFLWLTPARVGWSPWPLFGLRMVVTLGAAVLMFRFVEQPIRRHGLRGVWRTRSGPGLAWGTAAVAVLAILGTTALVTADLPPPRALAEASGRGVTGAARATKVLVVGDELAAGFQPGLEAAEADMDGSVEVRVAAAPGCGLTLGGFVRLPDGTVERDSDRCRAARDAWLVTVADWRPDVVVAWGGLRDVADRRLSIAEPWRRPSDPALDDFLRAELGALTDDLSSLGAGVVLLTVPHVRNATPPPALAPIDPATRNPERVAQEEMEMEGAVQDVPAAGFAENDDARIDRWNQILREVAEAHDDTVLDAVGLMGEWKDGQHDPTRRVAGVGLTAAAGTELGTWLLKTAAKYRRTSGPAPPQPADAAAAPLPDAPPVTPRRRVDEGRPVRVLQAGDSLSFGVGYGLSKWEAQHGQIRVGNAGQFGCPIARGGSYRFLREINEFAADCDWAGTFPGFLDDNDPDVVVLTSGIWEVVDRILPGDERWRHLGQPDIDHYFLRELLAAIDALAAQGASVVVLTYPHFEAGADQGFQGLPESDPARVDRLNELMGQAVALRPGVAWLADLQGWLATQPGGEMDPATRDDGLHFADAFVPTIADWLAPQIMSLGRTGTLGG